MTGKVLVVRLKFCDDYVKAYDFISVIFIRRMAAGSSEYGYFSGQREDKFIF